MINPITVKSKAFLKFDNLYYANKSCQLPLDTLSQTKNEFSWVKNPIITSALDELKHVVFDEKDVEYMKKMGLSQPFKSGKDAIDFIKKSNIRIAFADTGSEHIHAQYDFSENKILLNKKYQNTSDTADILALSEAILHESCHATDNDAESSIQEELNNLSMGVLAHKYFEKKYPSVFDAGNTLIVKDGVSKYAELFFDKDPNKLALKQRIRQKYGLLPAGDKLHPAKTLALSIKYE